MSHGFFSTIFYIPLYNSLIALINAIPDKSAGIAVIVLTLIIRFVLFPLSRKMIKTQLEMREIEPEVQKIKASVKDNQEQAKKIMALYKEKDVNPFAGLFLIIIQFPILIGLYEVFRSGLPHVDPTILYSFVRLPAVVSMNFFGVNLVQRSIILALITVVTQFIQLNIALPKAKKSEDRSFKGDLAYSMNMQMKYIFPLVIFPIAYLSSVVALYLATSNCFMIFQELFVRRRLAKRYTKTS